MSVVELGYYYWDSQCTETPDPRRVDQDSLSVPSVVVVVVVVLQPNMPYGCWAVGTGGTPVHEW